MTREALLATQFLATLPDGRVPWSALFERWVEDSELSEDLARAVRLGVAP